MLSRYTPPHEAPLRFGDRAPPHPLPFPARPRRHRLRTAENNSGGRSHLRPQGFNPRDHGTGPYLPKTYRPGAAHGSPTPVKPPMAGGAPFFPDPPRSQRCQSTHQDPSLTAVL